MIKVFPRRLTLRRLLLFGSAFFIFWILVFSLTPLTSPLPAYTGPHEVGILDLEVEVQRKVIHEARLKETGDRAFELNTLAVTLYYPTSSVSHSPKTPVNPHGRPSARPWLPRPVWLIGTGYARLAHVYFPPFQALFTFFMKVLGGKTTIPGTVDAPLLSSPSKALLVDESGEAPDYTKAISSKISEKLGDSSSEEEGIASGFPCVVFTHGMAGMSQSYSHYLGSLASHGAVVAAIEHRDGSGPGTIVHFTNGKKRTVWHVQLQDLEHDPPMTTSDLKVAQLAFREAEIASTIKLFRMLNAGHGDLITNLKPDSPRTSLPTFRNRLNLSAITVAGHSYGATGAMQALKNAPSDELPLNGAIVLDPGKSSGPLNKEIDVPILVMQSGEWTEKQVEFYGQGWHFEVVKNIISSVRNGWFMTLAGTAHPSCTDAPLIVPWIMKMVTGATLAPQIALREYIDASVEFMAFLRDRKKRGVLASEATSSEGPLGDKEKRDRIAGRHGGEWEIHVTPGS